MFCCRPLSLPANLIDLSVSSEDIGTDTVLESSADSVDSAGFFRRFADHMKAATRSRETAVYCKGATDYSFSQSPTQSAPNPASSLVNRSILVQAGFDPADSGDECPTEVVNNDIEPQVFAESKENRLLPAQIRPVSSSVIVSSSPAVSVSKGSSRKRWSDFGTRLVGFVDKILLPEVSEKPANIQPDRSRSGSDEHLCSLSAAHAIGRRSAGCRLSSQSDTSDVIQMYSDIGRLQKDSALQVDDTRLSAAAAAFDPLQKKPFVTEQQLSNDSVLRCGC